jgi:hypothetical protein
LPSASKLQRAGSSHQATPPKDTGQLKQNEMCYDDTFLKNNSNIFLLNKIQSLKRPTTTTKHYTMSLDGGPSKASPASTSASLAESFMTTSQIIDSSSSQRMQVKSLPKSVIFPFNIGVEETFTLKNERKIKILKKDTTKRFNRFFINKPNSSQSGKTRTTFEVEKSLNQFLDKGRHDSLMLYKNK